MPLPSSSLCLREHNLHTARAEPLDAAPPPGPAGARWTPAAQPGAPVAPMR